MADEYAAAWLKAHNDLRTRHGASALTWSSSLASASQSWAMSQAIAGTFNHGVDAGENLYAGSSSLANCKGTPAEATYSW